MDPLNEPTLLSTIESQKENILPLPGGRSARALAQTILQEQDLDTANLAHSAKREEYENELKTASELDDPLDPYLRYVKWVEETYTSGGGSLMQNLLYRTTHKFEDAPEYKNDARYLKLWTTWIGQFSDAPREAFAFLARKGIGSGLALYYEDFAAYLESQGRMAQAEEIYEMGIEKNARPVERLRRKYGEFVARLAANPPAQDEPSSPALPVVRAALGDKSASTEPRDPQAPVRGFGAETSAAPAAKKKKEKMQIFSDSSEPSALPDMKGREGGWDSIVTLSERKKENTDAPRPWQGEIMKQEGAPAPKKEKLQIFRDPAALQVSTAPPPPPQVTASGKPKKPERVFAALELVYPNGEASDECDFDELRAMSRGLLDIDWKELRRENERRIARQKQLVRERALADEDDRMMEDMMSSKHAMMEENKPEIQDENAKFVTKSTTLTVALSSSPKAKPKKKRKSMGMQLASEPTMTMHTRAANDEIYSIFNQPFVAHDEFADKGPKGESSDEDDVQESEQTDTMFSQGNQIPEEEEEEEGPQEAQPDMLKGAFDDEEDTGFTAVDIDLLRPKQRSMADGGDDESAPSEKLEPLHIALSEDEVAGAEEDEDEDEPHTVYNARGSRQLPFMTPITEQTESLPPSTIRKGGRRKSATTPSKTGHHGADALIDFSVSSPLQQVANHDILPDTLLDKPKGIQPYVDVQPADKAIMLSDDKENEISRPDPVESSLISFDELSLIDTKPPKAITSSPPLHPVTTTAVLAAKSQSGVIVEDRFCNPMDPALRSTILSKLPTPLTNLTGYYDNSTQFSKRTDGIRKYIKAISSTSSNTQKALPSQPVIGLEEGDISYTIRKELGKGAFAPVYLVDNNMAGIDDDDDEPAECATIGSTIRCELEAIKMEHPISEWEFYITRVLQQRLAGRRETESIVRLHEFHRFKDEAFLVLDYYSQGTVLDLINAFAAPTGALGGGSGVMDEILVMFITVELLRAVEGIHGVGMLHGDIKTDNSLVRLQPIPDNEWSGRYSRDGSGGWRKKGIVLIDMGRGIDMTNFQNDVGFIADWATDSQDPPEMREKRPWTYQIDYYGMSNMVHTMLFGKIIETVVIGDKESGGMISKGKRYKIANSMKRYWQGEIWAELFDILLNPTMFVDGEAGGCMPCINHLRSVREKMEDWLEANSERGIGLKGLLRKVEEAVKRRK